MVTYVILCKILVFIGGGLIILTNNNTNIINTDTGGAG